MSDVCVFDLGGTQFRTATLGIDNRLTKIERRPAINYLNTDLPPSCLQEMCVDFLCDAASKRLPVNACSDVSISFGGAVDARTGIVLDAAPLWGPHGCPFDLLGALRAREPRIAWSMVNDVTAKALAYGHARRHLDLTRICVVVIGTGVALRIYDLRTHEIPVGRQHGLQGEIGHIVWPTKRKPGSICDCGEWNHLSAFASGRSILRRLGVPMIGPNEKRFLSSGGDEATAVLREAAAPIADALRWLLTIDPEVEEVILTGGVPNGLGEAYRQALISELANQGLYKVSDRFPNYFEEIITIGELGDDAGLIGAGLWGRQCLRDAEALV
jgi:predicted NBD/HSP70 family sugar kinase